MKNNLYTRRIFILAILKIFLLLVLVFRLVFLQIKKQIYFSNLSDKNRTDNIPIIPKRGVIKDFFSTNLAEDTMLWELLFIKSQIKTSIDLYINTLSSILILSKEDIRRIKEDYKTGKSNIPILIKRNLTQKEIGIVETFSYNLQGIFIRPYYKRNYPYDEAFAHLIGYTGLPDDISKTQNVTNWNVGKFGLESQLDMFLRGEIGYSKYEVNAKRNILKKLDQIQSKKGNNVALTIIEELQTYIYNLLSEYNSATAVVIDIATGNVLAMCSYPSFDANLFSDGISSQNWNNLITNEKAPLTFKCVQSLFPPGSTLKPILALKALEKGYITKNTTCTCTGKMKVGNSIFHCWKKTGHGVQNVEEAIFNSCDIFFYSLANSMTREDMVSVAQDFGLGETHLPIVKSEQKGLLIDDYYRRYSLGDLMIATIGQSKWLTTPLQLAYMTSILASNGEKRKLNILKSIEYPDKVIYPVNPTIQEKVPYSKENLNLIKNALYKTVQLKTATAYTANNLDENWPVSGKTGTSQVKRISLEERKTGIIPNHELPWRLRDHGLFIGFVPFDIPKYSISVVVEHGGGGSATAAPIANLISIKLKELDKKYNTELNKISSIIQNNYNFAKK